MRLGIVGRGQDPTVSRLSDRARAAGNDVEVFDFSQVRAGARLTLSDDGPILAGRALCDVDAILVRAVPSATALLAPPGDVVTAQGFYQRQRRQAELSSVGWSALAAVERRGIPVINSVSSRRFDDKLAQLAALREAAMPLPRTIATNDQEAIDSHRALVGACIAKPVLGGAAAISDAEMDARLGRLAEGPVIAQERIPGDDVRVIVVGAHSMMAYSCRASTVDVRAAPGYEKDGVPLVDEPLTEPLASLALRAARACDFEVAGVDFKRATDGRLVVIEVNSAPIWLEAEDVFGSGVTDAVIALAAGTARGSCRPRA